MPLGFVYGSSSWRSRLRRRSSTGSMPISARRDVEQHLAGQRLELPRAAVRGAPDGVRVDRSWSRSRRAARGRARGTACRRRRRDRPATGSDRRRSRRRSRCARPGSRRRRRTPSSRRRARGGTCPAASRFSRRSSTHFTGAPTFGAASIRHISSRWTMTFCPNPPPVSRITTRMRCSGIPSRREQNSRTSCGDCVAA